MKIKKGDIYKVSLKHKKDSHLQGGIRPCIVVSSNKKNKGNIINITPLTTKDKDFDVGTHITIEGYGLDKESIALIEQTRPIDRHVIQEEYYIGTVTDESLLEKIAYANKMQFD